MHFSHIPSLLKQRPYKTLDNISCLFSYPCPMSPTFPNPSHTPKRRQSQTGGADTAPQAPNRLQNQGGPSIPHTTSLRYLTSELMRKRKTKNRVKLDLVEYKLTSRPLIDCEASYSLTTSLSCRFTPSMASPLPQCEFMASWAHLSGMHRGQGS